MALETLKHRAMIDGFEVKRIQWKQPDGNFIEINDPANAITFKIQNGPIKEVGVNGCQVDSIVEAAKLIVEGLNDNFPCMENQAAIEHLEMALKWMKRRKANREKRRVEGTSNV